MTAPESPTWVEISDFSPGITSSSRHFSTMHEPSPVVLPGDPAADGMARLDRTWGCIGKPSGGLWPAPAIARRYKFDLEPTYDETHTRPANLPERTRILALTVGQSTFHEPYTPDGFGGIWNPPDVVAFMAQRAWTDTTEVDYPSKVGFGAWIWTMNDIARSHILPSYAVPYAYNTDGPRAFKFWGNGSIVAARLNAGSLGVYGEGDPSIGMVPTFLFYFGVWGLDSTGALDSWRTIGASYPATGTGYETAGYADRHIWEETRPSYQVSQNLESLYFSPILRSISTKPNGAVRAIWHQQRLIWSKPTDGKAWFDNSFSGLGIGEHWGRERVRDTYRTLADREDLFSDELLSASSVLWDEDVSGESYGLNLAADSGRVDQIGAMCSTDTTQLWIVKARGGGVVINGSIEAGNAQRFPGVESTGNFPHDPVYVPSMGMVYGAESGVHVWSGGNQSQSLSPQIEGPFWLTPDNLDEPGADLSERPQRHPFTSCGKFAYAAPYIYAPNNWIMDTRSGGWWRLHPTTHQDPENGIDLSYFDASSGRVYAAPATQHPDDLTAYVRFGKRGASRYQWASHPFGRNTNGRESRVQGTQIVLSGKGVVAVVFRSLDAVSDPQVFNIDSREPRIFTAPTKFDGHDISVEIMSEGLEQSLMVETPVVRVQPKGPPYYPYFSSTADRKVRVYFGAAEPGITCTARATRQMNTFLGASGFPYSPPASIPTTGWTTRTPPIGQFGYEELEAEVGAPVSGSHESRLERWVLSDADGSELGTLYRFYHCISLGEIPFHSTSEVHWYRWHPTGGSITGWTALGQDGITFTRLTQVSERAEAPVVHRFAFGYEVTKSANRGPGN